MREQQANLSEISKLLWAVGPYFKDRSVYCPFDDPRSSKVWKYLHKKFWNFELCSIAASFYDPSCRGFAIKYMGGDDNNPVCGTIRPLKNSGRYDTQEVIDKMTACDVIITNPPDDVFDDFHALLNDLNLSYILFANDKTVAMSSDILCYIK